MVTEPAECARQREDYSNTWAVSLAQYSAGIVNWRKVEVEGMKWKTRKMMTIYGSLHPRADVDRLYVSRKKGGGELMSIQDAVLTEKQSLSLYVRVRQNVDIVLAYNRLGCVLVGPAIVVYTVHCTCYRDSSTQLHQLCDVCSCTRLFVDEKEQVNVDKYQDLASEIKRPWKVEAGVT